MTKRMLIDATHAEETRVVVLDGNRLEDFDVETSTKKQLKGNIYLAKVVRVEPSLQAAFVEYGGGRHGFLAFGEIHPDYYQIPVADRQRLLELQAEEAREEEEAEEAAERAYASGASQDHHHHDADRDPVAAIDHEPEGAPADHGAAPSAMSDEAPHDGAPQADFHAEPDHAGEAAPHVETSHHDAPEAHAADPATPPETISGDAPAPEAGADPEDIEPNRPAQAAAIPQDMRFGEADIVDTSHAIHVPGAGGDEYSAAAESAGEAAERHTERAPAEDIEIQTEIDIDIEADLDAPDVDSPPADVPPPETIGGETDTYDGAAEARARRASRLLRNYRIQEVIRRRQILLVQVVKEERGTKGAALTTYISLAGRFCVLMPNSPRGGGISRKITSASDRRRLKEITSELEIPRGMGLIVRTAGANRPKPEIKRDCEYLMRLWDDIREHTLRSVAPALIYEEASLIKRAIRDVYSRDVEEVLVDGDAGWRAAHDFMRMLMPSHAKKVQLWRDGGQPLFSKNGVEAQLDAMLSPTVQLRSGGYLVIAQTEALVSIDVNSGRSTRERGIEETALKTNLEAADEVARQLRLRDLAGLIVIDFIDMEAKKHNAMVERRMKEALKNDRARIQVGHISHFGLLEMSRQRLRPSLAETSFVTCPHCGGLGHVRSIESSAIHVLRAIEEEGAKDRASLIMVYCAGAVVMYLLNNKRDRLGEIEARYAMRVHFTPDDNLVPPAIRIDRLKPQVPEAERVLPAPVIPVAPLADVDVDEDEEADEIRDEEEAPVAAAVAPVPGAETPAMTAEESERRRKRRRRRRGARRDQGPTTGASADGEPGEEDAGEDEPGEGGGEAETFEAGGALHTPDVVAPAAAPVLTEDGQPVIDPSEFDENGLPRARGPRRSRRGGRRRRREGPGEGIEAAGEGAEVAAESAMPLAPAYVGPTPADPFGNQPFDIFDIMDEQETRAAAPRPAVAEPSPLDIPPVPPDATPPSPVEPHIELHIESRAEPDHPNEAAPLDQIEPPGEPMPVGPESHSAEPTQAEVGPPEPEPHGSAAPEATMESAVAAEPLPPEPQPVEPVAQAPAIMPIVIGQDEAAPTERKRGWWRR